MADNFHFDITGASLEKCLDIAMGGAAGGSPRLILYWHTNGRDCHPLPAPLTGEALVGFVKAWLTMADYGREPDHDGDNSKGWRVYNEAWAHVNGDPYAFVAIEPAWLMHGK